ncbi:E3 ubiquitin-protein ligase TRIM69 [Liparis tanakae]|uniref:E3 ubiquitin-protein ligase TRIM69 n=1 Tax=Liparis tanakae TaxID=230148 RepID=A0A4Z2H136_9TELE|nr:E3 ubiquitin-protein ligase TRIM69 [Liparis tanakae]
MSCDWQLRADALSVGALGNMENREDLSLQGSFDLSVLIQAHGNTCRSSHHPPERDLSLGMLESKPGHVPGERPGSGKDGKFLSFARWSLTRDETMGSSDVCVRVDGLGSVMEPELNCSSQCESPLCFIHAGVNRQEGHHILQRLCSLTFSTLPATKDWSATRVESAVYVGTVRRAVRRVACQLEETVKAEVKRLCETEFQRARQCPVSVTLDPETAHPKLVLSEDKKHVFHCDVALSLPDNPERFYPGVSVLGKEGFSAGRLYYEVQVKGKTEWDVGVGLQSVNRKGGNILNPETGYWALGMRKDKSYWALSSTPIRVPLVGRPQRVGVYVDVEWGQVSFYDVESASHIYSFTGYSFNERLFPYFNPRRNHGGVNSAPLVIVPVNA